MLGTLKRPVRSALTMATLIFGSVALLSGTRAGAAAEAQAASGAQIFAQNCARCHGDNGEGDRGPNLLSEKRRAKWGSDNTKLVAKISKGGFLMPAFKKKLSPQQIAAVADYVRSLK